MHNTLGGSSPLARGTLTALEGLDGFGRLIPARAGNTERCSRARRRDPAHPRSRGEHNRVSGLKGFPVGSSPLARGTLANFPVSYAVKRLIPARAGNTLARYIIHPFLSAHPRSRGEHKLRSSQLGDVFGSSPLARGTPRLEHCPCYGVRLIPARAGNTVHVTSTSRLLSGSSPLARGTPRQSSPTAWKSRLIPARAGNTIRPIRART